MNVETKNEKSKKKTLKSEYAKVNSNPVVKGIIQASVVLIDLFVMFIIIWNLFTYIIPQGSWLNVVDGDSMKPTLHNAQIIFTDTDAVSHGDIVTTHAPQSLIDEKPEKAKTIFIKRVIGVPGDQIEITQEGISVNGTLLVEDYIPEESKSFTYKEGGYNSLTLAADEYFIVGDNREVSYDSRVFGPIKSTDILYKQSESPTTNFWLKAALILLLLIFDVFLYSLIEFALTEAAYGIIYKGKETETDKEKPPVHTTTETINFNKRKGE